jgi:hypothetical protein
MNFMSLPYASTLLSETAFAECFVVVLATRHTWQYGDEENCRKVPAKAVEAGGEVKGKFILRFGGDA